MKKFLIFLLLIPVMLFAQVIFPTEIDPTNPDSLFQLWQIIYAIITPVVIWIINKFAPYYTKKELIIRSSSVAIVILIAVLFLKGFSVVTVIQAFLAFIMQVITYDKVLKPLGLESPKARDI